jgi:Pyruvate/2-oxoacid:ferredoxin oxidoreductase delta subunit
MPWFAGVSRKDIDWGPTIDAKKCVGCGVCLNWTIYAASTKTVGCGAR